MAPNAFLQKVENIIKDCGLISDRQILEHGFLTKEDPWIPMKSKERVKGVYKGHRSKVLYTFGPLLQVFSGPPVLHFENKGSCIFFKF